MNTLADMVAIAVFGAGLTTTAVWQVLAWQNRQRQRRRVEAKRVRVAELARIRAEFARIIGHLDDEPAEEDVPTLRTESIDVPREGEPT